MKEINDNILNTRPKKITVGQEKNIIQLSSLTFKMNHINIDTLNDERKWLNEVEYNNC